MVENRLEDVAGPHAVRCRPAHPQSAQARLVGAVTGQSACGFENLKTVSGKNPRRAIPKRQVPPRLARVGVLKESRRIDKLGGCYRFVNLLAVNVSSDLFF